MYCVKQSEVLMWRDLLIAVCSAVECNTLSGSPAFVWPHLHEWSRAKILSLIDIKLSIWRFLWIWFFFLDSNILGKERSRREVWPQSAGVPCQQYSPSLAVLVPRAGGQPLAVYCSCAPSTSDCSSCKPSYEASIVPWPCVRFRRDWFSWVSK